LNLRSADQLIKIERWNHRADDRQPIRFYDLIEMVDRDHVASAGHVLHDESGVTGNMFAHVFDDQTPPEVIKISGRRADDDGDGFSLIERRLCLRVNAAKEETQKNHQSDNHIAPPHVGSCDWFTTKFQLAEANRKRAQASRVNWVEIIVIQTGEACGSRGEVKYEVTAFLFGLVIKTFIRNSLRFANVQFNIAVSAIDVPLHTVRFTRLKLYVGATGRFSGDR
jgi:hypothetical protein